MHERFKNRQEKGFISQEMFRGFKLRFSDLAEKTVEWYDMGYHILLIILSDGEVYEYNDMHGSIRQLKSLDAFGYEEGDEEYYRQNLGRKLDKILQTKCIPQEDLAKACGVSQVTISNYIRGVREPNYNMLIKIAKALKCNLDDLV